MIKLLIFSIITFSYNAFSMDEKQIINLIRYESLRQGIDPNLALAIARNESQLNQNAIGSKGEIGIFQLRPEFHKGNLNNTKINIKIGVKYLSQMKEKCYSRYGEAWFLCFNTGPNRKKIIKYPKKFQYYVRVRKEMSLMAWGGY